MKYPNIAAERARHGLTITGFASALGVCRRTVYRWEERGHIPMRYLEKMADMWNCSIDYLLEQPNL